MKKKLLYTLAFIFVSQTLWAENSIEQKISSAEPFQYLHCQPQHTKTTDSVVHYIVTLEDMITNQLFATSAIAGTTAKNLLNLGLIDSQLVDVNSDANSDLSFKSKKNDLEFKLVIQDTDGQFLQGKLIQKNQVVDIQCKDVSIE